MKLWLYRGCIYSKFHGKTFEIRLEIQLRSSKKAIYISTGKSLATSKLFQIFYFTLYAADLISLNFHGFLIIL